jgi:hypothetical protein
MESGHGLLEVTFQTFCLEGRERERKQDWKGVLFGAHWNSKGVLPST